MQNQPPQQLVIQTIWLLALIVGGAVILIGVAMIVYRYFTRSTKGGDEPFTLTDLRRMHREGQLSDAELDRAKAVVITRHQSVLGNSGTGEAATNIRTDKTVESDSNKATNNPIDL